MANTYTTNKANLTEPGNGDYVDTWDQPLNGNFTLIDGALGSFTSITASSGNITLTNSGVGPAATNSYQNLGLLISGALSGNVTITIPPTVGGFWVVYNNTTGNFSLTLTTGTGGAATATVTQGLKVIVFSDGANVRAIDSSAALQLTGGYIQNPFAGAFGINSSNNLNSMVWLNGTTPNGYLGGNSVYSLVIANAAQTTMGYFDQSGNLTATGNVTAFSDQRVKHDIETIEDALEKIKRLRGVNYIRNDTNKPGMGVIAQELLPIVPEVIQQDRETGMLSVAYGNLVGLLIEGIKTLEERISALEQK